MNDYELDKSLADIMTYMEQHFDIPLLEKDVEKFCENYNNKKLFDLYLKISDMRNF